MPEVAPECQGETMGYTLNPGAEKVSELYYKIRCHHRTPILWKLAQLYSLDELEDELYFKEGRFCNDPKCRSNSNLAPSPVRTLSEALSLSSCSLVEILGAIYEFASSYLILAS